jgi:hypothetical protein
MARLRKGGVLMGRERRSKFANDAKTTADIASSLTQKPYNYIYNIDKGLRKWRLAKARLDYGIEEIINLNFVGDSITEGQSGAGNTIEQYDKNFVSKIRDAFASKYGSVERGFIGNRYPVGASVGVWSYAGTWSPAGVTGWLYSANAQYKTVTQNSTATITLNGTGIKVLYEASSSGGTMTVTVDGVESSSIDIYSASQSVKEYSISNLSDTNHTVVVKFTSNYGRLSLLGAYAVKGTKGVRVNKLAVAGSKIEALALNDFTMKSCIDYWTPKLTVLSFLGNDFNLQTPLATFESQYQAAITRAKQFGDVMIITSSGIFQQTTQSIPMQQYRDVLFKLAQQNDIAFVDLAKRIGDTWETASALGYIADSTHPKPEGHQDYANVLTKILLEDS